MLVRLAGFWSAAEPLVDAWFDRHPAAADELRWPRRRRLAAMRRDLRVLGATPELVPVAALHAEVDEAFVLGWLYVSEGSTLGGAVIDRALRSAGFAHRLESFVPYAEGPGPMWQAYLAHLEAWATTPSRVEQVVAAGELVFAALERWVTTDVPEAAA